MAQEKILTMNGLTYYDGKIKAHIDAKDAENLAAAKAYAESLGDNYDAAGTAQTKVDELANGAVKANTDALAVLNGTGEGSVDKKIADVKALIDADMAAVEAKADKNTTDVATNKEDIDTMKGQIAALEAGTYDDTEVRELIQENADEIAALKEKDTAIESRVKANEDALAILNGESDGSVKKTVDDAINKFATDVTDDAVVNSYKELIDWVAEHGSEAAEMAAAIKENETAISELETLVGALPEGVQAQTVVALIEELVGAEQTRATGVENGLDARLQAVEGQLGTGEGSVDEKIATAKQEAIAESETKDAQVLVDAKEYTDSEIAKIDLSGIQTNANDIAGLKTRMDTVEGDVATLKTAVNETLPASIADAKKAGTDAQTSVATLEGTVNTLSGKVTANETAISGHGDRLTVLESKIGDGYIAITNAEIDALFTA